MNIEAFRDYCLSLPKAEESTPFGADILVFKIMGKVFVICPIDTFSFINLKCDPEIAIQLRERYPAVTPGYHMNKKHWNSIKIDGSISDKLIKEWTKNSYALVIQTLAKKIRIDLGY